MSSGTLTNLSRRIFVHNFYLKFIAGVLTLALYIWVSEDRETIVQGYASVQTVVPDDMVLVSEPVDRVKVTIRGRFSDVNRFDVTQLEPIRIDLSRGDDGSVVNISPNLVRVPPGLRVTNLEPHSFYVELEPETFRTVPITPQISGEPPTPYAISSIDVTPQLVTIRGPESRLRALSSIPTESIDVAGRTQFLRRQVQLRIDDGLVTAELDEPVVVEIDFESREVTQTFTDVPVVGVNTTYDVRVDPPTTSVTLSGSMEVLESLGPDVLHAEIDLSAEDQELPGTYSRTAEVQNVPDGVTLERIFPERFRVTTRESDDR